MQTNLAICQKDLFHHFGLQVYHYVARQEVVDFRQVEHVSCTDPVAHYGSIARRISILDDLYQKDIFSATVV